MRCDSTIQSNKQELFKNNVMLNKKIFLIFLVLTSIPFLVIK